MKYTEKAKAGNGRLTQKHNIGNGIRIPVLDAD